MESERGLATPTGRRERRSGSTSTAILLGPSTGNRQNAMDLAKFARKRKSPGLSSSAVILPEGRVRVPEVLDLGPRPLGQHERRPDRFLPPTVERKCWSAHEPS